MSSRTIVFIGPEALSRTQTNLIKSILEGAGYSPTFQDVEAASLHSVTPTPTDHEVAEEERESAFTEKYYSVSLHNLDRRYGGPEEGGWWYDTGTVIEADLLGIGLPFEFSMPQFFRTPEEASIYSNALNDYINTKLKQRDLGSILSTGRVEAVIQLGLPHDWSNWAPYE